MTKVNSKNFAKLLLAVGTAFGTVRDNLQDLLLFGLSQYSKGNFTYINTIIVSKQFKGLSMKSVQTYIESHCDVLLEKDKDGVYKFVSQKTKGFKYVAPSKTWYEFSDDGAIKVVVPSDMLVAFIKRIESAISGEGKTAIAKKDVKSSKAMVVKLKAINLAA